MTYDKFLIELGKLYNAEQLPVRFFLQHSSFSYEIHHRKTAFLGVPAFISNVYGHHPNDLAEILSDIKKERTKIKNGTAKVIKLPLSTRL